MQLWRLLLDCKIHHHGTTLYYVDYIIRRLTEIITEYSGFHENYTFRKWLRIWLGVVSSNHHSAIFTTTHRVQKVLKCYITFCKV